ncbi:MAG: hypothetical protein ABI968_08570, partial [Acidobacteriota bacterium]
MLCKISPLFCPDAYPKDLAPGSENVPCWPEKQPVSLSRDTRLVRRPGSGARSMDVKRGTAETPERSPSQP